MREVLVVTVLALVVGGIGCAFLERGPGGKPSQAEELASSVAPMLPPPWGILVGGLATLATGVASAGANVKSNKAFKKKEDPGFLTKLFTDHSAWLTMMPVILAMGRVSGVLHMSDAELVTLMTAFVVPAGTKKVMRKKAA